MLLQSENTAFDHTNIAVKKIFFLNFLISLIFSKSRAKLPKERKKKVSIINDSIKKKPTIG